MVMVPNSQLCSHGSIPGGKFFFFPPGIEPWPDRIPNIFSKKNQTVTFKISKKEQAGLARLTSMSSNPVLVEIFSKKIPSAGIEPGPLGFYTR